MISSKIIHLVIGCDICYSETDSHIFKCFWCVPKAVGGVKYCIECMIDHVLEDHPDVHSS